MSTSIEQRVVQMKFDNKQFEAGVAQSMSTLDKLKAKLNFKGAAKSFEDISYAADAVSLNNLVKQTNNVGNQFDALAVVAISALNRITNEAITAGTKLIKSLSIDQVASGWSKYEARTAAVQTLVNATGKSVEQIEKYMDKLMLYSDETSYGFADMTSALATMVSAGGDINKLVPLLEGFGNAVSYVGKGAAEYSRAVIQLSQGYGRNALMLEDWKSIEQTLGGAKQLKQVFIEVAEEQGKIAKGNITIGTFNESLRDKWLDQEVMEKALGRFGEMTEKAFAMIEAGEAENVHDAYEILSKSVDDYRIKAAKAAQEAKSFTEAIEATRDAVSTKWMESFQIIFGNYEEATKLWSALTDTLWDLFAASGDTRNEILYVWRSFEGREAMIDAVKAAFNALYTPVQAVGEAIHEIFFPGTVAEKGLWLANATKSVRDFFESLTLCEEATENLKKGFKLLLIPVYAFYQILRVGITIIAQTIITLFALANVLLTLPSRISKMENPFKRVFGDERYARIINALVTIIDKLGAAFTAVGKAIGTIGKSIASAFSSKLQTTLSKLFSYLAPIAEWILDRIVDGFEYLASLDYSRFVDVAVKAFDSLIDGFKIIIDWSSKGISAVINFFSAFFKMSPTEVIQAIIAGVKSMKDNLAKFAKSLGFDRLLDTLATAGGNVLQIVKLLGDAIWSFVSKLTPAKILIFSFGVTLVWMFTNISMAIGAFKKIATGVTGVLDAVTGTLKAFQTKLKGSPILQISLAITVLAAALGLLSQIDSKRLMSAAKALAIVMGVLGALIIVATVVSKFLLASSVMGENLLKLSQSMILMATAAGVLSAALILLSNIKLDGIIAKLGVLAATITMLVIAIKVMSKSMEMTLGDAVYVIAFAASLNLMITAISKISNMELNSSADTLITMGVIVAMLVALGKASKGVKPASGLSLILFAGTLLLFMKAIVPINSINMGKVVEALIKMIAVVGSLALISKLMGKGNAIKDNGLGLLSMAAGMLVLYVAIQKIGSLNESVIIKGATTVGAFMLVIAAMNAIGNIGGKNGVGSGKLQVSFLSLAAAILVLGVAINYIGNLDLEAVVKGGTVVAALLAMLTLLAYCLGPAKKAGSTVAAITVCIGVLVASMALLTLLDEMELLTVVASLMGVFAALAVMFAAIGKTQSGISKAIGTVLVMSMAMLWIDALFTGLSKLKYVDKLLPIAKAIGIVLVALGASFLLLGKNNAFKDVLSDEFLMMLDTMITMIISVSAAIGILGALPVGNGVIEKASGLGIVLLALAGSMRILKINFKEDDKTDIKAAIGIIVLLSGLATVITIFISNFANGDEILAKAGAFSLVLVTMTGAIVALSIFANKLKDIPDTVISDMSKISIIVSLLGGLSLAITAALSSMQGMKGKMENLRSFIAIMIVMTAAFAVISVLGNAIKGIGEAAGHVILGAVVIIGIIAAIALIGEAIAYAAQKFGDMIGGIDTIERGVEYMKAAFTGIGEAVAGLIGGFIGGIFGTAVDVISDSLINFGSAIAKFGEGLDKFAGYVKGDFLNLKFSSDTANALVNIGIAAKNMVEAQAAAIAYMIQNNGENPLARFGESLKEAAPIFLEVDDMISDIRVDSMNAFAAAISALSGIFEAFSNQNFISMLINGDDIGLFGDQLSTLATGIADFAKSLSGEDFDKTSIETAVKLTEDVIGLASKLPESGVWQTIFGEQSLGNFSEDIGKFINSMKTFVLGTKIISRHYDQTAVDNVVKTGEALVKLAGTVPRTDALAWFFERHDIGEFGDDISKFGEGMKKYIRQIQRVNIDQGIVDKSIAAGETLVALAEKVPNTGTLFTLFKEQSLGKFGDEIKAFGEGLAGFFTTLSEAEGFDNQTISLARTSGLALAEIADAVGSNSGAVTIWKSTDLKKFAGQVTFLGSGMKLFYEQTSSINWSNVEWGIECIGDLVDIIPALESFTPSIADTFKRTLNDFALDGIEGFTSAFSNAKMDIVDKVYTSLKSALAYVKKRFDDDTSVYNFITDTILDDPESKYSSVYNGMHTIFEAILDVTYSYEQDMKKAGSDIVDYMIDGFNASERHFALTIENYMGIIPYMAAKVLDIKNGISELFRKYGQYSVDGYINGIEDKSDEVSKSVEKFAKTVSKTFADELAIKSPSKKFIEFGMYTVAGYSKGIDDNAKTAKDSMLELGKALLKVIQDYFGIHSPSTVMRDKVGRYIVQGIADGITEDMSAEEAAAKKAQNIISAFEDEFSKWSLKTTSAQLDFNLWGTSNMTATETETKEKELQLLEEKLTNQAEIVNAANAKYQALLDSGYATSQQIQEAKNAYTQEQLNMWELANELVEKRAEAAELLDLERAELEYEKYKLLNADATEDELKAKELEVITKKLESQATVVQNAHNMYNRMLELYGEDAKSTKASLNDYIKAENAMIELINKYVEDYNIAPPTQEEINDARHDLDQMIVALRQMVDSGDLTWDEFKEMRDHATMNSKWMSLIDKRFEARQQNVTATDVMEQYISNVTDQLDDVETAAEIVTRFLSEASGSIDGIVGNIQTQLINSGAIKATKSGSASGSSSASSGSNNLYDPKTIEKELQQTMDDAMSGLDLSGIGDMFSGGIIDGIRNNIGGFGDSLVEMASNGFNSLRNFFGIGSNGSSAESNVLKDFGKSVVDFFAGGIDEEQETVAASAEATAATAVDGLSNVPNKYAETGFNAVGALAGGMLSNKSAIAAAAQEIAQAAIDTSNSTLDIHSPSRVFIWIGEMIDEGLANGIEDSSSVVKNAIETVLDSAQNAIDSNELSIDVNSNITPVITDDLDYRRSKQALEMDKEGRITPYGYREQSDVNDQMSWWISTSQQVMQSIQQLSAAEEARRIQEAEMIAEYKEAVDELKMAAIKMADKPAGVNFTQNNYSPESLSASKIYRNTKTALATASAAASPSGNSTIK